MIEKGKKVSIHYKLMVDGEVVDSSEGKDPFEYEHGGGQIIPGLEKALEGLKAGDEKSARIAPEEAYGNIVDEAVITIPRENINSEDVKVGTVIGSSDDGGNVKRGIVREIDEKEVKVDFNHPLAGKELHFEITIIAVN